MKPNGLACRVSDLADAAISHPAAFVVFNIAWVVSYLTLGVEATNIAISILTADILFITAISARQSRRKMEVEVDELARVHPQIDERDVTSRAAKEHP